MTEQAGNHELEPLNDLRADIADLENALRFLLKGFIGLRNNFDKMQDAALRNKQGFASLIADIERHKAGPGLGDT